MPSLRYVTALGRGTVALSFKERTADLPIFSHTDPLLGEEIEAVGMK